MTAARSNLRSPLAFQLRRLHQGLHHHAILFRFFSQSIHLLRGGLGRNNIEVQTNALKADGHVLGYAQSASKIQVSRHGDLNTFRGYAHSRCNHLTGDLRASRESPKQKVT